MTSVACRTPFAPQDYHQCCYTCQVVHEFGNVYRCVSSGMQHVCDNTCSQRIPLDRYSSICKISKKQTPLVPTEGGMETDDADGLRKRPSNDPELLERKLSKRRSCPDQ